MSDDKGLNERLAFMSIDPPTRSALEKARSAIQASLPSSLDSLYSQIRRFPAVAGLFSSDQHMSGAKGAQERHWNYIASGQFDATYVESVQRIGARHALIGLEPRWYIGGYALVLDGLVRGVIAEHEASSPGFRWPGASRGRSGELGAKVSAVVKAALLDMDFVISIYLEAAEKARQEADARRLAAEEAQARVVAETAAALARLASGDMTGRILAEFPAEYAKLREDFNEAVARLEEALGEIAANAAAMRTGTGEISQAADDLSRRTEQQAATLEQTAAALDQITATVRRTAEGAQQATRVVASAKDDAERSGEVVNRAVGAMGEIERSAGQISQIIGVIDEIAFQTNLLALNAGVEAARAGDAGKGFAVVASEVRALAQRSAEAAKEIKTLISASSAQVKDGVSLVGQMGDALQTIVTRVNEINALMGEISASAQEQATALGEVNTAVNQMDQTTQQNAAMVEQSTAASHNLTVEAGTLAELVSRFTLSSRTATSRAVEPPAPRPAETPVRAAQARVADFARRMTRTRGSHALAQSADDDWQEF